MSYQPTCTEMFNQVLAIHPIPVGEIDYTVPFNVRQASTSLAGMSLANAAALATLLSAHESFSTVPDYYDVSSSDVFELSETGSLKATSKKEAAGYIYNVSVQMKLLNATAQSDAFLRKLTTVEYDLVIETLDGDWYLVRTPVNGYTCTTEDNQQNERTVSITIDINNVNGIQPIL